MENKQKLYRTVLVELTCFALFLVDFMVVVVVVAVVFSAVAVAVNPCDTDLSGGRGMQQP